MPAFAAGTQKVVRGLSRVSLVSSPSTPSSDLHALSTALFGSTPPSDDESPLSGPSASDASISPPPAYTTIYPPSPPTSAPSSPVSIGADNEKQAAAPRFELAASDSLLAKLFPATSEVHDLPATNISLSDLVPSFEGVVLNNAAAGTRTLFVGGGDYAYLDVRETVCEILERAEEELGCTGVVLAIEKKTADLGDLLLSLMYVGGVITTGLFNPKSNYLLVGLEL